MEQEQPVLKRVVSKEMIIKKQDIEQNIKAQLEMLAKAADDDQFEGARTLSFKDSALPEIPPEIYKKYTPGTEEIDLSGNLIEKIPPKFAKNLANITVIDLGDNQLALFPKCLCDLKQLVRLRLYKNLIKVIPPTIKKLVQLQELNLHNNKLLKIPSEMNKLVALTDLNLAHNPLGDIAALELRSFPNLRRFALHGCHLTDFPALPLSLKLEKLELNRNRLTVFPRCEAGVSLREVELSANFVSVLPESIGNFYHLETLVLTFNKFTELPDEIGALRDLKRLRASDNQISTLPLALFECSKLTELDLTNNLLTELDPSIEKLKRLQRLYLRDNRLTTLPSTAISLKGIERFSLSGNPIDDSHIPTMQVIMVLADRCLKGHFDWNQKAGSTTVLRIDGKQLKQIQTGTVKLYETEEGEILHPHSVRAFKANKVMATQLQQQIIEMHQQQQTVNDRKTKRVTLDWTTMRTLD